MDRPYPNPPSLPRLPPLPPKLAEEIAKGIRITAPPPGYEPIDRPPEELEKFSLPPRPDRRRAPEAYANWARAMRPPLEFLPRPGLVTDMFALLPVATRAARFTNRAAISESSRNWSGAFVVPHDRSPMALVQGTWRIPSAKAPPHVPDYALSTWVGLDGHDPGTRSMPQIGVQLAHIPPLHIDWLLPWWQWWLKPEPDALQIVIPSLLVAFGDEIIAQVEAVGPATVSLFIKNQDRGQAFSAYYTSQNPQGIGIEGRTAEWIVERPLIPGGRPGLANFGEVEFTGCNAAVRSGSVGGGGILTDLPLDRARLVRLNEWSDPIHPGRLVSSPDRRGPHSFGLAYVP